MTDAVRVALNTLAADVAREASASPQDILEITIVGNPIMHHLVLGIDPVELGGAPFALSTDEAITVIADGNRPEPCTRMPALFSALYCRRRWRGCRRHDSRRAVLTLGDEETALLVDVGTNAEIGVGATASAC